MRGKYYAIMRVPRKAGISYSDTLGDIKEHKRSGIAIRETEAGLEITIETGDITALRASMNAIIRDIQVIENTASSLGGEDKAHGKPS